MKKIIMYLLSWLVLSIAVSLSHHFVEMPCWYLTNLLFLRCTLVGVIGGVLYCLRAVYLNKCVLKTWDKGWEVWYWLRPITSGISGFISCVFLKAGLLVLEADPKAEAISFGYFAVAFIAGYNVDNFMKKLESIASSVWGIKKSRASTQIKANEKDKQEPEA
ncbi:hypothetical protein KA005_58340 [bacterium]|nr:hypothetical protein [bacterium]